MREAKGMSALAPVVASPVGDGTLAAGATQHGAARQGEHSGERMAFATRLAHVRDVRGYPETLSSYHSAITQHSRDSETQGDRKEQAYAA